MNPIFEFLHGKTYRLHGVSGTFCHKVGRAIYPYRRTVEDLYHEPDANGRRTKYYRDRRADLGDDWSTCLTQAIDTYCDIATKLGYEIEATIR
jgi:hypothetical protein